MNSGFIYLHRKLKDHWLWKNPFYFQWFVHFLFRANFKDNKVLIGSDLINVKRGEFITSIENLTKELNGSTNQKIRTFLKLLEKEQMIIKNSTSKLTKIYICNYDSYQTNQQTNNKPITNQQQTNNKPVTTENKDNKEKKVNNDNDIYKGFDFFKNEFKEIWINEFITLKKKKKASLTDRALKSQLNKILKLSKGNYNTALKILEKSVNSGWTDFYELKTNNQKNTNAINQKDIDNFKGLNPDRLKFKR